MAGKKINWFEKAMALDGAVKDEKESIFIDSPSPSVNHLFGPDFGIQRGSSVAMYGPAKSGKSYLANSIAGKFLKDNPDSYVIKFNPEYRESHLTPEMKKVFGLDNDRYIAYETNDPLMIFDRIAGPINDWASNGMDIGLIIIDSVNGIRGRRSIADQSIEKQQIGDLALTLKEGLKLILPVQRKHRIAMILTTHIAAELDAAEQKRGNKVKMAAGYGLQHHCEQFIYIEPWRAKDGRQTLLGQDFRDESKKDMVGNSEITGHKVRVVMKDNTNGPKGRVGVFTLDYKNGIINTEEEVFLLAKGCGAFEMPNHTSYIFNGEKWTGKESVLKAIANKPDLKAALIKKIREIDMKGGFKALDEANESANTGSVGSREKDDSSTVDLEPISVEFK
jgi:RecA/RadA recombinase